MEGQWTDNKLMERDRMTGGGKKRCTGKLKGRWTDHLSIRQSLCLPSPLCPSACPWVCMSVVCLSIPLPVCCLSVPLSPPSLCSLHLCLSVLLVCPSVRPFVHLSQSVHLSFCLSICLPIVCPSSYLSISVHLLDRQKDRHID